MSTIKLMSNDKVCFTVDIEAAKMSKKIKTFLDNLDMENLDECSPTIAFRNVSSDMLAKIIEWTTHHKNDPPTNVENEENAGPRNIDISEWDRRFLDVDTKSLLGIVVAAKYLQVEGLVELCCKNMVATLRGQSVTMMREFFKPIQRETEKNAAKAGCSKTND
ncbi:S-phase kinase-associated protein 1-like [Nasonia vitripennis]|uniref:SKP1 component POZ domain-containing protein n=1 Tax=Nasonia vitripennis TaxID=7425 RepID=A0A7M7G5R6_NASVI|nr:S-phase kinase-associated protein 1-like [Nasonia vitripennis]